MCTTALLLGHHRALAERSMASRWDGLAIALLALCAQYLFSNSLFSTQYSTGLRSWFDFTERDPEHMPVAKSERAVNEQQHRSAEKFAEAIPGGSEDTEHAEAEQPDEVRRQSDNLIEADLALRCGEKLPPESAWKTRGVEIFVKSKYRGVHRDEHMWKYVVSFRNQGADTVQMLARHWVFTDSQRNTHEMKGPGARGVTPVLGPGDSWEYESGTTLATALGSMHGSFQFATLISSSGTRPHSFSARVARLTLSSDDSGALTPCAAETGEDLLQTTSVHATRRVIVGVSSRYAAGLSTPREGRFQFVYDVQVNNARAHPVTVVGHRWEVQTEAQAREGGSSLVAGVGVGGRMEEHREYVPAGEAFRVQGLLTASAPTANARGVYEVRLHGAAADEEETIEVRIGDLALSADESSVPRYGAEVETDDDNEREA